MQLSAVEIRAVLFLDFVEYIFYLKSFKTIVANTERFLGAIFKATPRYLFSKRLKT